MEKQLHQVTKQCNSQSRLLEHAVWEEDMVEEELIVFNGATTDFVELIGPLLLSRKCTVNGKHTVIPFLRSLLKVFRIRYDPEKEFLAIGTLTNVVQQYLSLHEDDQ